MPATLAQQWQSAFAAEVQDSATAGPLKDAAVRAALGEWTSLLTAAVVRSCQRLGWSAAAKGHKLDRLPKVGQEYLGLDAMAFASEAGKWPLPVAVFELENSTSDDRVAYSLWKVLCVRARLRVVFAYRPDGEQGRKMVHKLAGDFLDGLTPDARMAAGGQTLFVIGNRGEGETFPWGYFQFWVMDLNLGRFEKLRPADAS